MMHNDLISRSALQSLYNAECVGECGCCKHIRHNPNGVEGCALIDDAHSVDAEPVRYGSWKHIKKHLWYKDDNGDVDMWRVDHGLHNGPECEICGECFCEHCDPDWADDECEIGYYVCSECEQSTKTGDSPYCPNCGARMDGGTHES